MNKSKVTLITGATSGIGFQLAQKLSANHDLILVGRRDKLSVASLLPQNALYIQADFNQLAKAAEQIKDALDAANITELDQVIQCAGTGHYGQPQDERLDDVSQTLNVNLLFPTLLAHQLMTMVERTKGKMTFIGSVAHKGSPNMASYAASKAGLTGLARSLCVEWQDRIKVQIIHPGPTLTPMLEKAGYKIGPERRLFLSPDVMATEIIKQINKCGQSKTIFLAAKLKSALLGLLQRKNAA
jgi:short-subunit dehydrogenase